MNRQSQLTAQLSKHEQRIATANRYPGIAFFETLKAYSEEQIKRISNHSTINPVGRPIKEK